MSSPHVNCDQRIAWLLTTSRMFADDPELSRRDGFIKALAEHGVHVDNSRISRWESGLQAVPGRVVAAYERVLGLPDCSLVAVAAGLRRACGDPGLPARDAGTIEEGGADADLDALLDLAESGRATGGQWLRLVHQLSSYDRVFLRQDEWGRLTHRLVRELAGSVSVGFVRRYEAAAALVRCPSAQRHMTRAIGGFVTDPDTQVVAPVLRLLVEIPDEAVGALVLRLLDSESRHLRGAAASVAAAKVARGQYPASALARLEAHVVGSLRRPGPLDQRLDSYDLAVQLPDEAWDRALGGLRKKRAFDLVTHSRKHGELVPAAQTSATIQQLSAAIQRDTPAHNPHEPDAMLRRLLREALLHAHKTRRHHAAQLLAASPYAPAISRHCQDLANSANDLMSARALTVLMRVGHGEWRSRLMLQALAETRPSIRARALVNLGLSPEPIRPQEADALVGRLDDKSSPNERHATMFALGMTGAPLVQVLTGHADAGLSGSARWWVQQGPAVHDRDVTPDAPLVSN